MMDDDFKRHWSNCSKKECEKSIHFVTYVVLVVDYALVISICMFLKSYASQFWADLWMFSVCAYLLKQRIDAAAQKIKDAIIDNNECRTEENEENAAKSDKKQNLDVEDSKG